VDQKPTYRLIEPTFEVEGGTPIDALQHDLNTAWGEGYEFAGMASVREPGGESVPVVVLKKRDAV
jgi:hypothetical protein